MWTHAPIRFHGVVLSQLSTEKTLRYLIVAVETPHLLLEGLQVDSRVGFLWRGSPGNVGHT
jgi:hypothetical protein